MENDRRTFLMTAGTLGIASLLLPHGVLAQTTPPDLTVLMRDDFAARRREWFYLHNADASHQGDLKLVKVRNAGSSARLQQFALILRSRRGAEAMPSGYYEVSGEPFSLYVKHTHEKRGKQFYRADFALLQ